MYCARIFIVLRKRRDEVDRLAQSIWQLFSTHKCDVYRIRSGMKRNNNLTGESLACPNIGKK